MLVIINVLLVGMNLHLSESNAGIANLLAFILMVFGWLVFPYTIAPILNITESPITLFSMRNALACVMGFMTLGLMADDTGKNLGAPTEQSGGTDPFVE